jgi:N-dimethylarginine dimethylaminohydrolase
VEKWMHHWMGYVEETVFDVNMLVIDEKNVLCNGYNQQVFDAFAKRGITPHVVNMRHRYFWDGGIHCMTSDLHREGIQKDYFPERA